MPPPSLRIRGALAYLLLAVGITATWWSIATGRSTPGVIALRSLAALGAYDLAAGIARILRNHASSRRQHRRH